MTTLIDYAMLGDAFSHYVSLGYHPVEVPWMVGLEHIRATAPPAAVSFEVGQRHTYDRLQRINGPNHLVGSAEQGFLSLDLPEGSYVGVTPCFRDEPRYNDFYQIGFMKIELFVKSNNMLDVLTVLADAERVMGALTDHPLEGLVTEEGYDLLLNSVEVGSYGFRSHPDFGSWTYGTGLALPRFTVADDILSRV